jgi:uncharacterized protein (TIGR02246 family)
MKIIILFSIFSFLFLSCQEKITNEQDLEQLKKSIASFYSAIDSGDFYKRIDLFTDDVIILPNNGDLIRGKEVIKNRWELYKDAIFRIKDLENVETKISGDIAYTINSYYYTYHNPDEEAVWYKTKNIHIWKRQEDGNWKLHADIWNNSEY